MLDIMRRNSNSWLIVLLFAVIIFVFAINFGPWVGNLKGETPYAADVNGQVISFAQLQMAYSNQIRALQSLQKDFNPEGAEQELIKKSVLQNLVTQALLYQLATDQDLSISDKELAKYIKTHILDQGKGIDRETYKRAIYSNFHMSEQQFENQLRQDLLAEHMSDLIESSIISKDEKDQDTERAKFSQDYYQFLKKSAKIQSALL